MTACEINGEVRIDLIEDFVHFTREAHISDLLETRYLENAKMARAMDGIYRTQSYVKDSKTLDKYIGNNSGKLRENF